MGTPTWLLHRIKSRESWLRFTLRSPSARKISNLVVFIPSKYESEDLNGKKEQNGNHQTQNPSKARQLKKIKEQTNKQSIRYMKNNTIQQQQQQQQRRRLIFRAEWTALNFCFSINQL